MDAVKVARFFVLGIFGFAIVFSAWAVYQVRSQSNLEARLTTDGHVVQGQVVERHRSDRSDSSTVKASYFVDVDYRFESESFRRTFSIDSSRFEQLEIGDSIEITVLPDRPGYSQLSEMLGRSLNNRGFVLQDQ